MCTEVYLCVSMCICVCENPQRPEKGISSPAVRVGCKSPNAGAGNQTWFPGRAVSAVNCGAVSPAPTGLKHVIRAIRNFQLTILSLKSIYAIVSYGEKV